MADFDINLVIKDGQAIGQIRQVRSELDATEKKAASVKSVLTGLFAGFGIYRVAQEFVQLANTSGVLDNRLRLATGSVAGASAAFDRLREISNATRSPLEENVALFQRVSQAQKELGASNEELYTFVKATGTALAIQGGSAATARGALIQLSQTIGGSIVHAEEFNSILDGALPLAQAAARGIDEAGGSVARLRQLVVEGKVSSRDFFDAIIAEAPSLQAAFEQTNATLGQSFTVLGNNILTAFREMDQKTGLTSTLANAMLLLANNVDLAVTAVGLLAAGFAVFKLAPYIIAVGSFIATLIEFTVALGVGATASLYFGQALAYVRLASLALLATPLGIWVGVITAALAALYFLLGDTKPVYDAEKTMNDLTAAMQNFRDRGGSAAAATALEIAHNNSEIARTAREATQAQIDLQNADSQAGLFTNQEDPAYISAKNDMLAEQQARLQAIGIEIDANVYREKQAVQEIIRAAEAQARWLEHARYTSAEAQKQYEIYGRTRRESEEQLQIGKDMLQKYEREAQLNKLIAQYGNDSYQATKLRNTWEIQALQNELKTLGVTESLKKEIIAAAIAKQQLGTINVAAAIELGVQAAGRLTSALAAAAAMARSIQIPSAGSLLSGLTGGVSKLGGFLNFIKGSAEIARLTNLKTPSGGGGGGGGGATAETFESQYKAMQKQIEAFGQLNKDQGLYNKISEITGQINRQLTDGERALVEQAYNRIKTLEKEQEIYGSLHSAAVDYGTSIAALNELVKQGAINQTEYALALSKVKLVQDLASVDKDIGGNFDHAARLQEVKNQLAERSNIIAQAREADLITEQQYQARLLAIQRQAHLESVNVEADRWSFAVSSASSSIDMILGFLKDQKQEQTGLYKAMFVAQKAAAIAEATINTARAVTNALAAPFPPPIPQTLATIAAVAGGAQIAGIIATAITGLATGGPVSGPGGPRDDKAGLFALSNGEYVINAASTAANLPLLEAINKGYNVKGMLAKGGLVNSIELKNTGTRDVEAARDTRQTKAPDVKVPDPSFNLINVSSKEAAYAALGSQRGAKTVMNIIEEDRATFQSILGISN